MCRNEKKENKRFKVFCLYTKKNMRRKGEKKSIAIKLSFAWLFFCLENSSANQQNICTQKKEKWIFIYIANRMINF